MIPNVSTSYSLPVDIWYKCEVLRINRSKIAQRAIIEEIERIEKETGAQAVQAENPGFTSVNHNHKERDSIG